MNKYIKYSDSINVYGLYRWYYFDKNDRYNYIAIDITEKNKFVFRRVRELFLNTGIQLKIRYV